MKKTLLMAILGAVISGCGGGGSSGSSGGSAVTGVEMPSNMSVVSAQGSSQTTGVQIDFNSVAGVLYDTDGTDYSTDQARVWVWDESLGPLQTVNEILCYMDQTAADEMVNTGGTGVYTALIDEKKCQQGQNTSSDTGQSSSQSTELNLWTVKSTRTSNSDPQVVHLWVPPSEPGDDENILVEVTAYEGMSASKPYGSFKMNFKGVDSADNPTMTGSLFTVDANTTGNPADNDGTTKFKLIMNGSENCGGDPGCQSGTFTMKTHVKFNDGTGTSGIARTSNSFTPDGGGGSFGDDYALAFDSDYFLRQGNVYDPDSGNTNQTDVCTDRNDFNTTVWRYNLYYSGTNLPSGKTAGERVQVNSGFPITVDVNGETEYGYIGYWGLWLPESVDTTTLTQVTRDEYGSGTSTVYDLVQAPGKLIKSTKSQVPLSELDGVTFNYWDDQAGSEFRVEYTTDTSLSTGDNVAGAGFYETGRYVDGQNGNRTTTTDLNNDTTTGDAPVDITPTSGQWLGMWSDGLGGNVNYVGGDSNVTFFEETFINTGSAVAGLFNTTNDPDQDGVITFDCFTRCLKSNISQTDLDNGTIFVADSNDPATPAVTYYFRRSDLTLYDGDPASGGNPVTLANGVTPQSGSPNEWGMATDSFVLSSVSLSNVWDTWNETVSFRWETGSNAWNKTFAVKEQGTSDFVEFDPPLQVTYKFTSGDDANAGTAFAGSGYYGKTFLLEYGGQGDLWGIPWEQQGDRGASAFTLADGTSLGAGDQYVVKAMEKEQKMKAFNDTANCTNAGLTLPDDGSLPLPTSSDIGTVSITLSGKPAVTEAPAVIEGEPQGS